MKDYELTPLEREVFTEMAQLNHTQPEQIYKTSNHKEKVYYFHYFADRQLPPLTDISPLTKLPGLMRVEIYQCNIRDLSPLAQIPTLTSITISGGEGLEPCDFTPLKNLEHLCLRYDRCILPKVTGLPLQSVFLSKLESLEGLRGLKQLAYLNLHENANFSDLSPLMDCPRLEELHAVDTAIRDLSPLAGHPSLKEIILSCTPVTDVSPLATIPTLETIWLYGTAVEDVSSLAALPNLKELNLRKTQVVNLSAFQGRESVLSIERKKLGVVKAGKSAQEIKIALEEVGERLENLGITPRPPLKQADIAAFQEKTGVKLPREYAAFLTKIGDGFEVKFQNFLYKFPPLAQGVYNPNAI